MLRERSEDHHPLAADGRLQVKGTWNSDTCLRVSCTQEIGSSRFSLTWANPSRGLILKREGEK